MEKQKVELGNLSPEDKKRLLEEFDAERKQQEQQKREEREEYKNLVDNAVLQNFPVLQELSEKIKAVKDLVFAEFDSLVALKEELYNVRSGQRTHSFRSADGNFLIRVGHRVRDQYDDTVEVGISKVKEYLQTLAKDDESASLVEVIGSLLKPDKNGSLRPSRVLELKQHAIKIQDATLLDGVSIIENAYKPAKSCQFIEARYKDSKGKEHSIPLSISAFDFIEEKVAEK